MSEIKTQKPADVTAKVDLKKSNPKEYYASSSLSFKAPVPPFHPFCRCQMRPKYAAEYSKPKLNADADKEYLQGLKEWQRA